MALAQVLNSNRLFSFDLHSIRAVDQAIKKEVIVRYLQGIARDRIGIVSNIGLREECNYSLHLSN
ncbi:MAG TPA: hypothetical protein VEL11_11830 [Candidatus Bathyarchaeia archaeon]|nr:hypothetical protein [Candidatus Bathyarchaeia archaeon]